MAWFILSKSWWMERQFLSSPLAPHCIPSVLKKVNNDLLFLGSTVASSLLLRSSWVEEEIINDVDTETFPVKVDDSTDLDDDDDGDDGMYAV
jgi:cleavage and polyadenylation specificity factor subunit 1